MKNLWPESFKESDFEPPKFIFDQQAKLLSKLTGDIVYAELRELSYEEKHFDDIQNNFGYAFYLKGKFLANYSFKILSFSHDIKLYPMLLNINSEIKKELNLGSKLVEVTSPKELETLLGRILSSDNVSEIIGAIISMS